MAALLRSLKAGMGRALGLGAILSAAFSRPAAVSLRRVVKLMLTVGWKDVKVMDVMEVYRGSSGRWTEEGDGKMNGRGRR